MSASPTKTPRGARMTGPQRRQQLIEVGRALFAEKGFEGTTVEEEDATVVGALVEVGVRPTLEDTTAMGEEFGALVEDTVLEITELAWLRGETRVGG